MSKQSKNPNLFTYTDFRTYIRGWTDIKGRGELKRISEGLNIHSTLISQILSGKKCLTEEQASKLCLYMKLNPLETDYFIKLVQLERAGSIQLANIFKRHLQHLRKQANQIKSHIPQFKKLSKEDYSLFYSSWQYGLIRLLPSIKKLQTLENISSYLNIPPSRVQEILDFLTSRGLCIQEGQRYMRTEYNTHIDAQSYLSIRHHQNWRTKALELHENLKENDLAFTSVISLGKKDIPKVREIILKTISEVSETVTSSPSEEVMYLGIDWLKI